MYIFIVFKYVNLILRRKTTFKGELAYIFVDLERSWINFRYLWSKTKYFQRAEEIFQGFGVINALFYGSKGLQIPLGPR